MLAPPGQGLETALPANSTPTEPDPETGSYLWVSSQVRSVTQLACESPDMKMVLLMALSYRVWKVRFRLAV